MFASFQRSRARKKIRWIEQVYPEIDNAKSVLDLGCAEGYLGEYCSQAFGSDVSLADVVDMNKTDISLDIYDGSQLPYQDAQFDLCLLVFVLHHTEDAETVLLEAARVSRQVIVLESVYESDWDLKQLTFLDKLFNRIRSGGLMNAQEENLYFRRSVEWKALFSRHGLGLIAESKKGKIFHQQSLFILDTP